jgi:predicted ester cyclase
MTQSEAQSRISPEWAKDWVDRFLAADNSRDLEQLLSFVTDDVTYSNPRSGVVEGKAAIAKIQEALYGAFPDIAFEAVGEPLISTDGTRMAFEWKGTGTFTGRLEPQGVEPTGARFELTGIEVAEFKGRPRLSTQKCVRCAVAPAPARRRASAARLRPLERHGVASDGTCRPREASVWSTCVRPLALVPYQATFAWVTMRRSRSS